MVDGTLAWTASLGSLHILSSHQKNKCHLFKLCWYDFLFSAFRSTLTDTVSWAQSYICGRQIEVLHILVALRKNVLLNFFSYVYLEMTLYLRNKPIKQHTKGNVQWEECVFGLKGAGQKSGAQCSLLQQKQPCLGSRDRLWEWSKAKGSRAFLASSVHQPSPRALGIVTIQRNKPSRQESGSITHTSPFPTEPLLLLGPMTLAQTFNSLSPVLASLVWCSSQSSAHLSVWNSGSFCLHPLLDPLH